MVAMVQAGNDLQRLTVPELRRQCRQAGCRTAGLKKQQLVTLWRRACEKDDDHGNRCDNAAGRRQACDATGVCGQIGRPDVYGQAAFPSHAQLSLQPPLSRLVEERRPRGMQLGPSTVSVMEGAEKTCGNRG